MTVEAGSPGSRPRILIVDDEAHNRQLLQVMLASEDYDVDLAESGEEAIQIVSRAPPDLILLDVMMPGLDGYQVVSHLKAGKHTQHIPIILVTSLDYQDARLRGLRAGAEDFLTKPVDRAELCVRVRNLPRLKTLADLCKEYSRQLEVQNGLLPGMFGGTVDSHMERVHPEDRRSAAWAFRRT